MLTVLLVIQIFISIALVSIILIQNSSSDGLSGLGGGQQGDSILSGRASANVLTKSTAILATAFMLNSLAMATLVARDQNFSSRLENVQIEEGTSSPINTTPEIPAAE